MPSTGYTEENIQTISEPEHIRLRPGMYIGNTGAAGLNHLLRELLANAVDEVKAGFGDSIGVTLFTDGSCAVSDGGRGIGSQIEMALTAPGFTTKCQYRTGESLHGLGLKVVAALSEWGEIESFHEGEAHRIEFERGLITAPPTNLGPADGRTGTSIHFKPDPVIFGDHTFDLHAILHTLCELAFLYSGILFTFTDERTGKTDTFHFPDGLAAFVKYLNTGEEALHEAIRVSGKVGAIGVEVAFQYSTEFGTVERGYANGEYAPQGGMHITGFRRGLREAFRRFVRHRALWPDDTPVMPEDIREGIKAVVCIDHPDPHWESATRSRIGNLDAEQAVAQVVREGLTEHLEKHSEIGIRLCECIALNAEARVEAKKARDRIRANRRG